MNVCVFCGSGTGVSPVFSEAARNLGLLFGRSSTRLIYGGGKIGLMGTIATAVMDAGGEVIGVIPRFLLDREVGHMGITSLEIVDSMHERKMRMAQLADAFVALPGGWGTMEELCEILTWKQLQLINQPVALLNTLHFFDPLLDQMRLMVREGFLKSENLDLLHVATNPEEIFSLLTSSQD